MDRHRVSRPLSSTAVAWAMVLVALLHGRAAAQTFLDVPGDHWAYNYIEPLAASGITTGCGGANYCPLSQVTRAQMAVFLERGMHGSDFRPPAATGNVFLDVGAQDFAASYIEQLFLDGITSGCGGNNYCPNAIVTRAQMAVFLLRAKHGAGYSPPAASGAFGDVPLNHWAVHWIEQLARQGITGGCGGGNYCPDAPVTRDQMAVFLIRTFATQLSGVLLAKVYPAGLYVLAGRTDVAPDTTVVFSAGSRIVGQSNALRVFGEIDFNGTADKRVHLQDVNIMCFDSGRESQLYRIEMENVVMNGGSLLPVFGDSNEGSFSIVDSRFTGLPTIYLGFPRKPSEITRSAFENSQGLQISVLSATYLFYPSKLTIRNNRFRGYAPSPAVSFFFFDAAPALELQENSFLDANAIAIELTPGIDYDANVPAANNYWGTTNSAEIRTMIRDRNQDLAILGEVTYMPYLMEAGPDTPR